MGLWGIVVAGGSGTRFGTLKQLEPLGGERVIDRAVGVLRSGCPVIEGIVVVVPASVLGRVELPGDLVVAGGETRAASVGHGLDALPVSADRVLVHDGARPLTSPAVVQRVVEGLDEAPGVVPVVAVTDSLRHRDGGAVDREDFVAVQTPQGFHRAVLERAHRAADAAVATDDASLLDHIGERVLHVAGEPTNLKITEPTDLAVAELLLEAAGTRHSVDRTVIEADHD